MKKINIKILLLTIPFLLALPLYTQSVNDDFLDGIPDDLKKEILSNGDDDKYEEDVYISEESKIKKTEHELNKLIKDAARLEKKLNYDHKNPKPLLRYGSDIFSTFQTTFMPINEPNVDQSYIVDVGDGLRLKVIGSLNIDQKLRVMRDGSISIPEVGKMVVAGLELNQVNAMVKKVISDSFIGNTAFITLTDIRNIKVYILGNVPNPGLYTLNGNSNVIHAISVAGGINENGSYRNIDLKRSGVLVGTTDLYQTLINGDTSNNHALRSGDVVLIKSANKLVSISGAIARPAIYELKEGENLLSVIEMAGGITGNFLNDYINIASVNNKRPKKVLVDDFSSIRLKHSDSISVPFFKPDVQAIKTAMVTGAVNFPGEYNISENETLTSLIAKAGGYKKNAYPYAGVLTRKNSKEKATNFLNKEYGNLVKFLIAGSNGTESKAGMMASDSTSELLEEIRNYSAWDAGRFTIDFDLDKISRDPSKNTLIQDNDAIHIPEFSNEVFIFGEFNAPGVRSYSPNFSIHDYIELAGGIGQNAFKNGIIVIDPDGNSRLVSETSFISFLNGNNDIDIYPHSIIFVPRDISKLDDLTRTNYIAQIAASALLPILTLISVNND
jgi:protein involved in polysaccharide export with SLBB domain